MSTLIRDCPDACSMFTLRRVSFTETNPERRRGSLCHQDKGSTRTKRPMTGEGELRAAFESAGFAGVADTMLTIRMDYANFEDFWHPMVYGQGTFGSF